MIKTFEEFICDINSQKIINEKKAIKSNKYTIDDINWLELNDDDYIDGYIHANCKRDPLNIHVPLNIDVYVTKRRINAFGMTYAAWATESFSNNMLMELKRGGFDIENPQLEEGWYYMTDIINNTIFISCDDFDVNIPLPAYDIRQAFEPGGELYKKSPKQISDIFKINYVGEYVD